MVQISALVFRRKFGKILDRVVKKGEDVVVLRGNKPLVVITPYDHYAPLKEQEERRQRIGKAIEDLKRWRQENANAIKGMDSGELIRKTRDSRFGEPI